MMQIPVSKATRNAIARSVRRSEIDDLKAEIERLRAALKAIADNDCAQRGCDVYQMARDALANG